MSTTRTDGSFLRLTVLVIAVILLVPLLMMIFAMPMMGMMGWWLGGAGPNGLSPLWGFGMMLVWLLVLIGIGYAIYRAMARGPLSVEDRALEELRVAYARGDLTDEEFRERREALERSQ